MLNCLFSLKDAYRSQRVALGETSNIVKDLETKVYERQRQLDAMGVLQDELAKARTESEANRRERHQLRKQVDRNDKQVNELQEQLTYARSHLAALEGENAKVAQALAAAHELRLTAEDRLKTAEDSLQQTLQESSEAQTALEAQLREVRERYDETNDRAEELASQLGQAQETTIDLQSRLDQAESTLSESQQLVDSLQNDISELRSSNTTLEGDLDDLRQHAENAAAAHLDRMTSMEADLRMSQSAHDATASARDSAVAQLEELSQKNLHIAQQLREFEDSSHRLRLDLEDARNSGSQMSSTISGLRETVEQLDQARTEVVNQAIAEAAEHQNRIHDLEAKLSSAEEEAQQSRSTTQQQLEALKSMNDELAEKLVDLKGSFNFNT